MAKYCCGMTPGFRNLERWGFADSSACLRCGHHDDPHHLTVCPEADEDWDKALKALRTWLDTQPLPFAMAPAICNYLQAWKEDEDPEPWDDISPELRAALEAQNTIGWGPVLEGLISSQWKTLVAEHFTAIGSKRSANRWATTFATRCSYIIRSMWKARNTATYKESTALDPRDDLTQNGLNEAFVDHYNRGQELLTARYSHMFRIELEKLLTTTPDYKREWLSNVVEARARRARQLGLEVDMSRERNLMSRYFGRGKRRPDPKDDITPDTGEEPKSDKTKRDSTKSHSAPSRNPFQRDDSI